MLQQRCDRLDIEVVRIDSQRSSALGLDQCIHHGKATALLKRMVTNDEVIGFGRQRGTRRVETRDVLDLQVEGSGSQRGIGGLDEM